jgi:hypothetical protein
MAILNLPMSNSNSNSNSNSSRKRKSPTLEMEEHLSTAPPANNTNSPQPEDDTETTITCPRCHHAVPSSNRVVHEVNCARRVRANEEFFEQNTTEEGAELDDNLPVASVVQGSIRPPSQRNDLQINFSFPRSRPEINSSSSGAEDASHHNTAIAQSLADVMIDDAARERNGEETEAQPYSLSYQDVSVENVDLIHTSAARSSGATVQTAGSSSDNSTTEASAEWACPRCTLLNPSTMSHCDACLFPRQGGTPNNNIHANMPLSRPPDPTRRTQLIGDPFVSDILHNEDEGWVNISHRDMNGTMRVDNVQNFQNHGQQQRLTTGYRIFNSALNGAMIGSVFGGVGGMIFGGLAGGLGGAWVSRFHNQEEANGSREVVEVLRNSNNNGGSNNNGSVRVHRGRNHLIAVSSDGNGSNRILRLRYNNAGGMQPNGVVDDNMATERALSEMLLRMSYMHGIGGRGHGNIVLQPNLSYEELLQRYGMGDENRRGASQEVIDSYPVVVVGKEDEEEEASKVKEDEKKSAAKAEPVDYGTCGICLEDYQQGDHKKCLSCPHSFHKDCIDRWLKQVASCPICKKEADMYQSEKVDAKPAATIKKS